MKIAFPLLNEKELAIDFVHSHFVGIFDDENGKTDLLPLSGIKQNFGIVSFFDVMTSTGLHSVVSPYYSFMALRVFQENNIETFKSFGTNLEDNIKLFKSKSLESFNVYESIPVRPCAKSCGSCDPVGCTMD